jgi:hypothetical protein
MTHHILGKALDVLFADCLDGQGETKTLRREDELIGNPVVS